MEDRRKKYLRIFKAEAEEHLSVINLGLVEIEQGKTTAEALNNIFRAAHTLKGSSRMLGLEDIGAMAHKMEDLLKEIEQNKIAPAPEVIDRLLAGADAITRILAAEGEPAEVDHERVIARLVEVLEKPEDFSKATPPAGPPRKKARPEPKKPEAAPEMERQITPEPSEAAAEAETKPDPPLPAEDGRGPASPQKAADTLRVEAGRLDYLIDVAGELLINKLKVESKLYSTRELLESLNSLIADFDAEASNGNREAFKGRLQEVRNFHHAFVQEFMDDVIELDLNVQDIQTGALQLRMTPASMLFDEFPRLVRDLARELGKEIRLEVRGEDTELDKRLLEQLRGPLIHILRNACDHGIEPPEQRIAAGKPARGEILIQANHQGPSALIEVSDDGAGMDPARVREVAAARGMIDEKTARELSDEEVVYLTLKPGFSTSPIITDLSGRGVGLDVVKTNIEAMQGDLSMVNRPGQGLSIQLRAPLTVSIITALLVMQGGDLYALPLTAVEEIARIRVNELVTDRGREAVSIRGRLLPVIRLRDLLGLRPLPGFERDFHSGEDLIHLVVLKFRNQQLALEVDKPLREQEIIVKGLGSHLKRAPLVSGATLLRKGEPALILNVFDLFGEALRLEGKGRLLETARAQERERRVHRILVVDDSITTRTIEKNILDRAGYEVVTAVSGEDALERLKEDEAGFDLFVVDIDMPGIDGFELTQKLRSDQRTQEAPVIICTSRASDEDKRRGISVGAQAYIVKGSFDQNLLLETVKSLIGD